MGIIDAPGITPVKLAKSLRSQGLAVVANNPNGLNYSSRSVSGTPSYTCRTEHFASADASQLRLVFGNWYWAAGIGGIPNINPILVKASFEKLSPLGSNTEDQPRVSVSFAGARFKVIDGVTIAISDPAPFQIKKGEKFFVRTMVSAAQFGNGPSAPALTLATTGGAIATGKQYYFALSYVFPMYETVMGSATQSTATSTGSTNKLTVTAPTAATGALGYRVWMTASGGGTSSSFYVMSPVVPFGTNYDQLYDTVTTGIWQSNQVGFPMGKMLRGGTSFYGIDNGEGNNSVADITDTGGAGAIIAHVTGSSYSPIAIIGNTPSGAPPPSIGQCGDSIQAGTGDDGLAGNTDGGALRRKIDGITTRTINAGYAPAPNYALINGGPIPGETLTNFLSNNGTPRIKALQLASTVVSNYGTNDAASGAALLMVSLVQFCNLFIPGGVKVIQETYLPKSTSTDGWRTHGSQTAETYNVHRVAVNEFIRSTATAGTVSTDEAPFKGGIDGVNRGFQARYAFIIGTETVKVNGSSTGAYTYANRAPLNDGTGRSIAGGVVLTVAPSGGSTVTITSTTVPGMAACVKPAGSALFDVYDVAALLEVNSSGAASVTAGLWLAPPGGNVDSGTITSANSSSITDSTKSWTVSGNTNAGWKGYCVRITADATTPTSVGQVLCIAYNSATQVSSLSGTFTVVPSAGASYEIFAGYTVDGVHPSSDGYNLITSAIDLTKVI